MFEFANESSLTSHRCPRCQGNLASVHGHVYCEVCQWNLAFLRKEMRRGIISAFVFWPPFLGLLAWLTKADAFGFFILAIVMVLVSVILNARTLIALPAAERADEFASDAGPVALPRMRFEILSSRHEDKLYVWFGYGIAVVSTLVFVGFLAFFVRDPVWTWEALVLLGMPLVVAVFGVSAVGTRSLAKKKERHLVRTGTVTGGVVYYGHRHKHGVTYSYEYFVGGKRFTGSNPVKGINEGDQLLLLYDPADPKTHLPVPALEFYRPMPT